MSGWRTHRASFSEIPGWLTDRHSEALVTFARSDPATLEKPYKTGAFDIRFQELAPLLDTAAGLADADDSNARIFFETNFITVHLAPADRDEGFVTGYYEPIVKASRSRSESFCFPVYAKPDDLVEIDENNPPAEIPAGYRFARKSAYGLSEYFDRADIEKGALEGRGLEIAWLADPVDLFFIHVQGAARLVMEDGSESRITYAAKSGHPFTGPGKVLANLGEIPLADVTMQSIRAWFRQNPQRINEILWQNRSFIFFRSAPVTDRKLGPVAAAKVPLTAGRSIAIDRLIHTFATPFFIDSPLLNDNHGKPFRRLMIAQDTGSAIIGPARADIFFGSGDKAGENAGVVKHAASFYILVPKTTAKRLGL